MNRFLNYIRDTKGEFQHVAWPTRRQALTFTIVVIVISVLIALYLGFFDFILAQVLQKLVL